MKARVALFQGRGDEEDEYDYEEYDDDEAESLRSKSVRSCMLPAALCMCERERTWSAGGLYLGRE